MNQKKVKLLRKSLGMTKENNKQKEYNFINKVSKVVYFKDKLGDLNPVHTVRAQVINTNLNFYRKEKKKLQRG